MARQDLEGRPRDTGCSHLHPKLLPCSQVLRLTAQHDGRRAGRRRYRMRRAPRRRPSAAPAARRRPTRSRRGRAARGCHPSRARRRARAPTATRRAPAGGAARMAVRPWQPCCTAWRASGLVALIGRLGPLLDVAGTPGVGENEGEGAGWRKKALMWMPCRCHRGYWHAGGPAGGPGALGLQCRRATLHGTGDCYACTAKALAAGREARLPRNGSRGAPWVCAGLPNGAARRMPSGEDALGSAHGLPPACSAGAVS